MGFFSFVIRGWSAKLLFNRYDDFPASVSLFQVTKRLRDITQLVSPVDNRRQLSGMHEIGQDHHVFFIKLRDIGDEFLANKARTQIRVELADQTRRHTIVPPCSS